MATVYAEFNTMDAQTFCEVVEARAGWSVAAQARAIFCEGDPLEWQNSNAVELIADIARSKGETEIFTELRDWLKSDHEDCWTEARFTVGQQVEAGAEGTDEHDAGKILAIDGDVAEVGWESGTRTRIPISMLRGGGK